MSNTSSGASWRTLVAFATGRTEGGPPCSDNVGELFDLGWSIGWDIRKYIVDHGLMRDVLPPVPEVPEFVSHEPALDLSTARQPIMTSFSLHHTPIPAL